MGQEMRVYRAYRAASAGLSAALLLGLAASAASARTLVAPASAGPPQATHVKLLDLDGFFPRALKIHVGDSVSWRINGLHTVTFVPKGQAPPPFIVPATTNPITGKFDAAGLPFWFNGQPNLVINPAAGAPSGGTTYSGGSLNSGVSFSGSKAPFKVKFTRAGTFKYYCLVHPGMTGVVSVLPKTKRVPSAAADRATGKSQARAAIRQARKLAKVKPPTNTVLAGHDGGGSVAWLRFFPQNLKIKAGTTVNFAVSSKNEIHTITVGPSAYTRAIENSFTTPQPNPSGPPTVVLNPLGAYPSDPPPLPPFTGANHGNGFENSGILAGGGGPNPASTKITFTKPGVYRYECVVHPGMDGTITVTS